TIYCNDLLPMVSKKKREDKDLIKLAKKVSAIMAIITMFIAPLLMYGSDGVFLFTKRFAGFFNIPIVALFVVGIFNKTVSSKAANIAVGLHILLYFSLVWVFKVSLNFQHVMGGLFVFDVISMLILGKIWEKDTPYEASTDNKSGVDLHEWKY